MAGGSRSSDVRITYEREGYESAHGHRVRHKMEERICELLMSWGVAHRHGSELFAVKTGVAGATMVYVPDIILHDRRPNGKRIIIEPIHAYAPKGGGSRIIRAFRKTMRDKYFVIIVVKKHYKQKILKNSYDLLIDYESLETLKSRLPIPKE